MIRCELDGRQMDSRAAAHQHIAKQLELPMYYGSNLDALWDLSSTIDADVTFTHVGAMLNHLQAYGCKLLAVLYQANEANERFHFRVAE